MKHPFLVVLLLGFGALMPSTCSTNNKHQTKKNESYQQKDRKVPKQLVLCAPVATIKLAQPRRA